MNGAICQGRASVGGGVWVVWLSMSMGCRSYIVKSVEDVPSSEDTGSQSEPEIVGEPSIPTETGLSDTGEGSESSDDPDVASWCLDWESGTLEDLGYVGSQVELEDGAIVLVAVEGQEYSALKGEDLLDYRDEHALVLRSSHLGRVESVAVARTAPFVVAHSHLWWWQLSEVREEGIALQAALVDVETGDVVAEMDIPVETGGFVPALQDTHEPIDGFPEVDYGDPVSGVMVRQTVGLSEFMGQTLALRFSQHTEVIDNGFFTLLDDICVGESDSIDLVWNRTD